MKKTLNTIAILLALSASHAAWACQGDVGAANTSDKSAGVASTSSGSGGANATAIDGKGGGGVNRAPGAADSVPTLPMPDPGYVPPKIMATPDQPA